MKLRPLQRVHLILGVAEGNSNVWWRRILQDWAVDVVSIYEHLLPITFKFSESQSSAELLGEWLEADVL